MNHFTGAGNGGKLAHFPPSNWVSRLYHRIGKTSVVEYRCKAYWVVLSPIVFISKLYLESETSFTGSFWKWVWKVREKASMILSNSVALNVSSEARLVLIYVLKLSRPWWRAAYPNTISDIMFAIWNNRILTMLFDVLIHYSVYSCCLNNFRKQNPLFTVMVSYCKFMPRATIMQEVADVDFS